MIYVLLGSTVKDEFVVVSPSTFDVVSGIDSSNFSVTLLDPDGSNREDIWGIEEKGVGTGIYTLSFIADELGGWVANVVHEDYFPGGQSENYEVVAEDFFTYNGDLSNSVDDILALLITQL